MASTNNGTLARELTDAVLILQTAIQKFTEDVEGGRQDLFSESVHDSPLSGEAAVVTVLAAVQEETKTHLKGLLEEVVMLERQLRSRGEWRPPQHSWDEPLPTTLDLANLSSATRMLSHLVRSAHSVQQQTPQQTLSAYSWSWDPAWHEFYTFLPTQNAYIYLSQWKLNAARGVWEHVSMAGTNLLPDTAAEKLGTWEDWEWDAIAGQWYLDMGSDTGEKIQMFASPWRIQEDGEWLYVGPIGQ
ncbi:hypothetical protein yc1106_08250 [Curvularia clavata]|uniref:Uncharacterized protein n=1 Tax=Curvularia clavata TaxID=95742 RepID=A0A9Q9DWY7_CURCL|nr:hypothetical protein yc1106_08250 [Curvularia clavata]